MNAGIVGQGASPIGMPLPLLGRASPVPMPYGRAGDPYWNNVVLMLPMDGLHGSAAFTDRSDSARTVTSVGGVTHTGQTSPFGSTSGLFNGTNASLTLPAAAWPVAREAFTVEFFIRWSAIPAGDCQFVGAISDGASAFGIYNSANDIGLVKTGGTATVYFGSKNQLPVNQWNHLAFTRTGNAHRCFVNGRITTAGAVTSNTDWGTATAVRVGTQSTMGINWFNGNMAWLRVTRGVARYTSNFPPLTAPFPIGYQ